MSGPGPTAVPASAPGVLTSSVTGWNSGSAGTCVQRSFSTAARVVAAEPGSGSATSSSSSGCSDDEQVLGTAGRGGGPFGVLASAQPKSEASSVAGSPPTVRGRTITSTDTPAAGAGVGEAVAVAVVVADDAGVVVGVAAVVGDAVADGT